MQNDRWFVFRVQSGLDNKAEASLSRKGFEVFRPLARRRLIHRRYKTKIIKEFSLFPGYLFVQMGHSSNWMVASKCQSVLGALGIDGVPLPLPLNQVEGLQAACAAGEFDDLRTGYDVQDFPLGSKIEITKGAFKGLRASIQAFKGNRKVRALVDWIVSTSAVELPLGSFKLAN